MREVFLIQTDADAALHSGDPELAGFLLEDVWIGEPFSFLAGDDDRFAPGLAFVFRECNRKFFAMIAHGGVRPEAVSAAQRPGIFSFRVRAVPHED